MEMSGNRQGISHCLESGHPEYSGAAFYYSVIIIIIIKNVKIRVTLS